MNNPLNSKPLFVFELANNHSGSMEHGLDIIREFYNATEKFREHFDFGFKLQYRYLDSFIHPDFKTRYDLKYVKRFQDTSLKPDQFKRLKNEINNIGYLAICTPFDENSVDLIDEHNFDIIKIASCSFTDWPLLERVAKSDKPIICSAAGAYLEDIDKVVSFFEHRDKQLALMHCVAEYPTSNANLQLNQIDLFKNRYQGVRIGYSTHENPNNYEAVKLAIAKGATIFEKHIGLSTKDIKLNNYSASPVQVIKWLEAALEAFEMCGANNQRSVFTGKEIESLISLRRGVFAKREIKSGEIIEIADVFLAIPTTKDQVTANDLSKYTLLTAIKDIEENQPVLFCDVDHVEIREKVKTILDKVKVMLHKSKVVVPQHLEIEISHHYGIDRFYEFGITIINYFNREYCKKLIIILPRQTHPEQYHQSKEETFVVLFGDFQITLDGIRRDCKQGDVITVEKGVKHIFSSQSGAVIEEISSTHIKKDSYYTDPVISSDQNRKTVLTYWLN